ncbi:MAG: chemotaxis protein CheB [Candidatus Cohnella colombiensis]|uniref:Protein-glutamate methylesterase/protein-glutamine glutaminase n=1 Tax=Candidatus Cohnella colombiensis TaxID=3121368 RepID=A0AA95F0C8_9BACL|nr:MAG: chemotaxis protein CheB [Cohnella sp.]
MSQYNVLIVDDSPFMRKVFSDAIAADAVFKVLATATNGEEAVELALTLKPDIITMDMEMPQMNGIEALRQIMASRPTPVIMLSAMSDNATRDTILALQYGAFDFIRKPDGALNLDIRTVCGQLIDKLHTAIDAVKGGAFRMLPAVVDRKISESLQLPPSRRVVKRVEQHKDKSSKQDIEEVQVTLDQEGSTELRIEGSVPKRNHIVDPPSKRIEHTKPPPGSIVEPKKLVSKPSITRPEPSSTIKRPSNIIDTPLSSARKTAPQKKESVSKQASGATPKQKDERVNVPKPPIAQVVEPAKPKGSSHFTQLVAIGTSTGGPRALHEVLTGIPANFPAPILVVQHMPPKFTHSLAQRLDTFCNIHVKEAVQNELIEVATAYIAPGGKHMTLHCDVQGAYRINLTEGAPRSGHKPSVDEMFDSLVGFKQLKRHAVIMTGMGSDGAKGMKALQEDGAATTIAEAEQTCVVYGMPRSAVELGAASHILPLEQISSMIVQKVKANQ